MFYPEAIATDLDRTLLRNDKTVSHNSIAVLKECNNLGIQIIIATARAKRLTTRLLEPLSSNIAICNNGSQIYFKDELIYSKCIEYELAVDIWETIQSKYPKSTLSLESNDTLFADNEIVINSTIISTPHQIPKYPVDRLTIGFINLTHIDEINNQLPDDLYAQVITDRFIMIMHKEANKKNALEYISSNMHFSLDKTICFGDDRNDLGMFSVCGCSVAVSNAIDCVKEKADYITLSNETDGVAKFICENVLA